ncbi:indole-3-glycerol phosphate synthase / phosphoribosylanthranilate isomerase [Escherichia coli]|uniref:phosphoribosylanthranilate isomerase n=1 Tax=Escherichia coli TaxID=562 RepID=UPI0017D0FC8C|nr:hypothetical protein [Escherichia coli]NUV04500.1 indole-3-glycerol phosphate synthase / phosphoribosylanthranilate isomerase [Escherichia coli]
MVGLFVDADDAVIADALVAAKLNALQLHVRIARTRGPVARAVWQAVCGRRCPSPSASDVARAAAYAGAADLILFDAKTPKGALPAAWVLAFRLVAAGRISRCLPWGLAGGLNPTNVAEAIARTGAPLVDTSSGVESAPGVKDTDKITNFALRCAWPKSRPINRRRSAQRSACGARTALGEVGKI